MITPKRIIVVLGMHRSGTSAITHGLNVLGVDLGERLMPPVEGNNAKGFFEDLDLYAFNVEILQAIGSNWHCLTPIEPRDVETLHQQGYFLRAVDLLRQKTANVPIFGFKDPRVAKLLPFWQSVFTHCGFDIGYVLAIRNPLNIALSLANRDGFSHEKSYMLWLGHTLTSIAHTEAYPRVLVDYDLLLDAPQKTIALIANQLDLSINTQALQTYQSEFLEQGLRHSFCTLSDLRLDQTCPPLAQELYTNLLDAAQDGTQINKPEFHTRTTAWINEFDRLKPTFRLVDQLAAQIDHLNQSIAMRDSEITSIIKSALQQDQSTFQSTFDAKWYVLKYPDIDPAVVAPYQHYIHYGIQEGRIPSADLTGFVRNGLLGRLSDLHSQYNQAKIHAEAQQRQQTEQEKIYVEHEQSLSQQLQASHQELLRLGQARALREQEFATQLLAIQQQADANKSELNQQHQAQIEVLQHQQAEHEKLTAERIQALNQQTHHLQAEQITREHTHTATLTTLHRKLIDQTQQQAQREHELATQLLAIQQQADANKSELSQRHQTQIEAMQHQQGEHEKLTTERIQALNQQIHHLQAEQITREQTHTAALTKLHRELIDRTQQQALREHELAWQLHSIQSTYSWRLTEPLRQAARLFNNAFFNNTYRPEIQNVANTRQQLMNIKNLKKMNPVTDTSIKLDNLLSNNDALFIYHAYRTILRRPPDPAGMLYYLQRLQNDVSKIEILAQLRLSVEGQAQLTPVQGLDKAIRPYRWRKLPLLGSLLTLTGIVPKKVTKNIAANKNAQIEAAREMVSDAFEEARGEIKCELQALHQLERNHMQDQWLSQGEDPHFSIILNEATPVMPGWHVIRFTINTENKRNVAKFYFDYGNGFSETNSITIPYQSNQTVSRAILFEQPACAIRFDPLETAKAFTIENIACTTITETDAILTMVERLASTQEEYKDIAAEDLQTVMQAMAQIEKLPFTSYLESKYSATFNVQQSSIDYAEWLETIEQAAMPTPTTLASINQLKDKPLISIVMPVYNPPIEYLRASIDSVIAQSYSHWELCIADDVSPNPAVRKTLEEYQAKDNRIRIVFRTENGHISRASNSALELATGDFVALMDHDDALPEHALYFVAMSIAEHPTAQIFYSDEDKINENDERFDPHFKSDWNPDLFFSQNYVSHLGVYRRDLLNKINGFRTGVEGSQDQDLLLRCLPHVQHHDIIHIPHVLYHWRAIAGSTALASDEKDYTTQAGMKALRDYFQDNGPKGVEVKKGLVTNTYHVVYPIPEPAPLVSLLIPTRDRRHLVEVAVRSILDKSTYTHYEILILDNGSVEQDTLEFFKVIQKQDKRVKVLRYDHPFNYSAINNFGVEHAKGSIIGLINNDIEVISPGWLTEMVSQACRTEIGCVGAKLYFSNDTIQHGGVIMSLGGVAGHSHKYFDRSHPGYFHRLDLPQNLSGVTAAVLVVRREVYEQVNGLDEVNLRVAFNDVDFCLKVREAGYRNLWTPYAELYHYESISRGTEDTPEKQARFQAEVKFMQEKWGDALVYDPYYNPNLTRDREDFSISSSVNQHT